MSRTGARGSGKAQSRNRRDGPGHLEREAFAQMVRDFAAAADLEQDRARVVLQVFLEALYNQLEEGDVVPLYGLDFYKSNGDAKTARYLRKDRAGLVLA